MTAIVVQDTSSSFDSGAASAWTLGLASLSVGNLVYVWGGAGGDASTSQISETKGHVFTNIRGTFDAVNSQKHASWYYIVSTTGTTTIDLGAAWHTNSRMGAMEISGLATVSPIDNAQEVGAIDTTTNGTDAASGGTLTTANANDFIVCSAQNINENEAGTLTFSAGSNFTGRTPTGTHVGKMETREVTSTGSYNAVFTGNADQRSIVHGVAFKLFGTIASSGAYAQESSTSDRYQLEDGSGVYLIEPWPPAGGGVSLPPFMIGDLTGLGTPGRFFKDRLG